MTPDERARALDIAFPQTPALAEQAKAIQSVICGICGRPATTAAGPANEPICAECDAEMMVQLP